MQVVKLISEMIRPSLLRKHFAIYIYIYMLALGSFDNPGNPLLSIVCPLELWGTLSYFETGFGPLPPLGPEFGLLGRLKSAKNTPSLFGT
jgi:hypothetical protein